MLDGASIDGKKAGHQAHRPCAKKYNLTNGQRELLHDEMEAMKEAGEQLTKETIEELAKDIIELYPNK